MKHGKQQIAITPLAPIEDDLIRNRIQADKVSFTIKWVFFI